MLEAIEYIIYFLVLGIVGKDAVSFSGLGLVLASVILNWQHFKQPVRSRGSYLGQVLFLAAVLLIFEAMIFLIMDAQRVGVDLLSLIDTNRMFLVCLWLGVFLLPVPRLIKRLRQVGEDGPPDQSMRQVIISCADGLKNSAA